MKLRLATNGKEWRVEGFTYDWRFWMGRHWTQLSWTYDTKEEAEKVLKRLDYEFNPPSWKPFPEPEPVIEAIEQKLKNNEH